MNGFLAAMQQALDFAGAQVTAMWNIGLAVAVNKPEPARNVIVYTLVLAALLAVAPKIIKIVSK